LTLKIFELIVAVYNDFTSILFRADHRFRSFPASKAKCGSLPERRFRSRPRTRGRHGDKIVKKQLTMMSDPTNTALARLIQRELEHRFSWLTRDELSEHREKILSLMQRRFGTCFSCELIRKVAELQVDQLSALTD
jgi:hypothetical protein